MKKKNKKPQPGGARQGAGRPATVEKGIRIGVYVEQEDIKQLALMQIDNLSEFYRDAGKRIIVQHQKKQMQLPLQTGQ